MASMANLVRLAEREMVDFEISQPVFRENERSDPERARRRLSCPTMRAVKHHARRLDAFRLANAGEVEVSHGYLTLHHGGLGRLDGDGRARSLAQFSGFVRAQPIWHRGVSW